MDTPPVPGFCHPAIEQHRVGVKYARNGRFLIAVPPPMTARFVATDHPTFTVPDFPTLEFTATKAAQSLYPEYGSYVWKVWTDQHGRSFADDEAEWVQRQEAFLLPEWNPPAPSAHVVNAPIPPFYVPGWRTLCSECGYLGGTILGSKRKQRRHAREHLRDAHGLQTAPR